MAKTQTLQLAEPRCKAGHERGMPAMDNIHGEFMDLLNAARAGGPDRPAAFDALLDHSQVHFADESALMAEVGFFATGIHEAEHARVLAEMQVMRRLLSQDQTDAVRAYLAEDVPAWFRQHLATMDSALAAHARAAMSAGR